MGGANEMPFICPPSLGTVSSRRQLYVKPLSGSIGLRTDSNLMCLSSTEKGPAELSPHLSAVYVDYCLVQYPIGVGGVIYKKISFFTGYQPYVSGRDKYES